MFYARPPLEPHRTAIIVIDMINWMFPWRAETPVPSSPEYQARIDKVVIPNIARLIAACRRSGGRVVYLRAGSAAPDFSDAVVGMQGLYRQANALLDAHPCRLVEELAVEEGDIDLPKIGSGGFTSSELHSRLRQAGITHALYTGVGTSACVLSTVMAGFDLGYHGYVVTDATAARTDEMHEAALAICADYYAERVTTARALDLLSGPEPGPKLGEAARQREG